MKHLLRSSPSCIFRIFTHRSLFHSGTITTATSSIDPNDNLQRRIARAGNPKVSIIPVLDQWLDQGKQVKPAEIQGIIKMLRRYNRFSHALEVLEWMKNQRAYDLSTGDFAVQLDLISKVHGLEAAEKYFESIPVTLRGYHVYGALLNCYASKRYLEKAEAIMQKMRELSYLRGPLSYNVMLKLYNQLGKHEKVEKLFQEMEDEGIELDRFTFNTRLHAYVVLSDIEGMEKFLTKGEADPSAMMGWQTYVTAANGYLKGGLTEKALAMLKRSEQLVNPTSKKFAYEVLMTVYANAGKKEDVYRLWNLYKNNRRFYNTGYMAVMSSLLKLDDIEGVEKILEEWESGHLLFDIRVPHLLITGYCKKGMLEKAEEYVIRLGESGKALDASTWERLAFGYKMMNQMEKAVEKWKKAILASEPGWRPHRVVLGACVDYLEGKGDVENLKEVLRLLSKHGHLSGNTYDGLVNDIDGGNLGFKIIDAMKGDRRSDGTREDEESLNGEADGIMDLKFEGNP